MKVCSRDRGHLDAQHLGGALRVVARGRHHMFRRDHHLLVAGHQVAALFDHLRTGHFPMGAGPVKGIGLHLAHDLDPALARTLCHGLRHIGRINIAILGVVNRALQIIGMDQRPAFLDLVGRQPFIGDIAGLGGRGV